MTDESTALTVQESVKLGTLDVAPSAVVARATKVADALAEVIRSRELSSSIRGKEYVRVEGWTTLCAMLGVTPCEIENVGDEDGVYTSTVELVRASDGAVIGRASAECGAPDEVDRNGTPIWASRPRYARRSMAATRATGKACRLAFSWIMALAGYEPTPAEEMDGVVDGEYHETIERPLPSSMLRKFMEKKVAKYGAEATATPKQVGLVVGMLELCFAGDPASEEKRHSVTAYLFDIDSSRNLNGAQVLSLLDWLKPKEDSGGAYSPDHMAVKEAQAVVAARMKELGQEEIPFA